MKFVNQLICHGEDDGDCFRACVASILELPVEDVPNFSGIAQNDEEFWDLNNTWAATKGFKYVTIYLEKQNWSIISGILCIASAKSPRREDQTHAVVWHDGIIHDPHPSNDFLAETPEEFTLFVSFNLKEVQNVTSESHKH